MTTNLTQELARLNELDAKRTQGKWATYNHGSYHSIGIAGYDGRYRDSIAEIPQWFNGINGQSPEQARRNTAFIAAAPDAIALANKMHALLVQAEEALEYYSDEEWLGGKDGFASKALTAIRKAGIGRE